MGAGKIRPIVLCLFRYEDRFLVSRGYDSVKRDYFYRPLGGGIEFGESSRDAIIREIREELSAEIENVILLGTIENIFTLEGKPGHEIVMVYDATFVNSSLYEQNTIIGYEHGIRSTFVAEWRSFGDLQHKACRLVPEGLAEMIAAAAKQR